MTAAGSQRQRLRAPLVWQTTWLLVVSDATATAIYVMRARLVSVLCDGGDAECKETTRTRLARRRRRRRRHWRRRRRGGGRWESYASVIGERCDESVGCWISINTQISNISREGHIPCRCRIRHDLSPPNWDAAHTSGRHGTPALLTILLLLSAGAILQTLTAEHTATSSTIHCTAHLRPAGKHALTHRYLRLSR